MKVEGLLERISLPVEEALWALFSQECATKKLNPKSILFVGDNGCLTLPLLAQKSYPTARISVIEKDPQKVAALKKLVQQKGASFQIIQTDILNNREPKEITTTLPLDKTDLVVAKHLLSVFLFDRRVQSKVWLSLEKLSARGGVIFCSFPTILKGRIYIPGRANTHDLAVRGLFNNTTVAEWRLSY